MITRFFTPIILLAAFMFATAPLLVAQAPYESTMGMIQKIFYYHVPPALLMLVSGIVCGVASARYLMTRDKRHDHTAVAAAEISLIFGTIVLITGPLWARKAWGIYWDWDVRLTSTLLLWMIFAAYLLLRRFGGPGSDRLAAGVAIFGAANSPFVYWSVNVWRTLHPKTTVIPTLAPSMRPAFYYCLFAFLLLYLVLLKARSRLEAQRALLDEIYLARDDDEDR
jgi:heme exporter protein C